MIVRRRTHWFRGADTDLVVAVWVARTRGVQFHAGLYHRDHGAAKVLHFAWDLQLVEDAPENLFEGRDSGLIALSLDDDDVQTLCALCRQVAGQDRFLKCEPSSPRSRGERAGGSVA